MDPEVRARARDMEQFDNRYSPYKYTGWRICDHPREARRYGTMEYETWVCRMCGWIDLNEEGRR